MSLQCVASRRFSVAIFASKVKPERCERAHVAIAALPCTNQPGRLRFHTDQQVGSFFLLAHYTVPHLWISFPGSRDWAAGPRPETALPADVAPANPRLLISVPVVPIVPVAFVIYSKSAPTRCCCQSLAGKSRSIWVISDDFSYFILF